MDNNELALALREAHLERIIAYLSRAGVQVGKPLHTQIHPSLSGEGGKRK